MPITTIVLTITSVFAGGGDSASTPKDEGTLKKWLNKLADALKRLVGKGVEALPAIVLSVLGAILSFLGQAVGFVAENTWALIIFVTGVIGVWLMQKVLKQANGKSKKVSMIRD